jgi:hypothetical protein
MHTQLILYTNSIKIKSLDLIHPLSQSCHLSYTHSLVYSTIHSHIHFTRSLSIRLFTHSPIRRLSQSITFTFTPSFNQSQVRSRPSSVSHAFIHSFRLLTYTDLLYLSFVSTRSSSHSINYSKEKNAETVFESVANE